MKKNGEDLWQESNDLEKFDENDLENGIEDKFLKNEYESSFLSDASFTADEERKGFGNNFPLPLNPQFDLQIQLQVS